MKYSTHLKLFLMNCLTDEAQPRRVNGVYGLWSDLFLK